MVVNAHNHRQQEAEVEGSQRIIEKKKALTLTWEGPFFYTHAQGSSGLQSEHCVRGQ